MTIEQAEEIFDDYGYTALFEAIRYPMMVSGELDDTDPDMLARFFDAYSFEAADAFSFAEFICHFLIFKKICMNNKLPF